MVSFKFGLKDEGLKIKIGNRAYDNLDQYSPGWKRVGPSIYGAFNSYVSEPFEYNEAGEPIAAIFDRPIVFGTGKAEKRIKMTIAQLREEVLELEKELNCTKKDYKSIIFAEKQEKYFLNVDLHAEIIRGLLNQRVNLLRYNVDLPMETARKYSGLFEKFSKSSTQSILTPW